MHFTMVRKAMPGRPRSHELETESIRGFERLLPSSWVTRQISSDYGIDLEVEIFDKGQATGETFKVQLKATDRRSNRSGFQTVSIEVEKLNYWSRLDTPVLVVLYSARESSFYAKWAQSYDFYYLKRESQRAVTFRFGARDRCNAASLPAKLRRELAMISTLRRHDSILPLAIEFELPALLHGHKSSEITGRLHLAIRRFENVVRIASSDEEWKVTVDYGRDTIRLSAPANIASSTYHHDRPSYDGPGDIAALCADTMLVVAGFVLRFGHIREAAELITFFAPQSGMCRYVHIRDSLIQLLLGHDLVSHAWLLVADVVDAEDEDLARACDAWLMQIVMHDRAGLMSPGDKRQIIDAMHRQARRETEAGRTEGAGRIYYTIAELQLADGFNSEADRNFRKAAELDPKYLERGYYLRQVGGLHFSKGDYLAAADLYRKAVEFGGAPEVPYLLADALMHAGRFSESGAVDYDLGSVPLYYRAGARIQSRVVATVRGVTNLDAQLRKPIAKEVLEELDDDASDDLIVPLLCEGDALHPHLWFRLATCQPEASKAFEYMLVSADLLKDCPVTWLLAMAIAKDADLDNQAVEDLCQVAFRFCGEERILQELDRLSQRFPKKFARIRDLVYAEMQQKPPKRPRVVRILDPDGNYTTFDVDNHDDRSMLGIFKFLSTLSSQELGDLDARTGESELT